VTPVTIAMSEHPSVGIVVRTKNRPVLLRRAIESIVHQTYANWMMAIVNDGGDEADVEFLAARYRPLTGNRISVIHNPVSLGMEGASKVGLVGLDSDLLVFHDDDDSWAPEFLSIAVNELLRVRKKFPDTQGVATYAHLVRETVRGNLIEIDAIEPFSGWVPRGFLSLDRMLAGNFIPPISFLFSRQAYLEVGSIYEVIPYLGDWDFLVRFLSRYDVYMIPQFLAFYHWRWGSEPGGLNNTVTAEVDQHHFYKQYLLNAWLRRDFAAGKAGPGTYANLRIHVEELLKLAKSPPPAPPAPAPPAPPQPVAEPEPPAMETEPAPIEEPPAPPQEPPAPTQEPPASPEDARAPVKEPPAPPEPSTSPAEPSLLPQTIFDYYWESLSWRALRPVRSALNRLLGAPPEIKPEVYSVEDAWTLARNLQETWCWQVTAPLRWAQSLVRIFKSK